jgi:hypothetical protein
MAETLDALLQQFNEGTASPPVPAQRPQPSALELDQIERHRRDAQVAEEQHQRNLAQQAPSPDQALQAAVRMFRSGDLADADATVAEGYILARSLRRCIQRGCVIRRCPSGGESHRDCAQGTIRR